MLMIGLGVTDKSPKPTVYAAKAQCELAANVINDQAAITNAKLHASCSEIEFINLDDLNETEQAEKASKVSP